MTSWLDQITPLPITRPSTVHGYANGELPPAVLVEIDVNKAKLIQPVAAAYKAMKGAAAADGIELRPTSAADGYRSYIQQATTFRFRYVDTGEDGRLPRPTNDAKRWNGDVAGQPATWWDKRDDKADAAVPGTSNHGWACAVDIANAGVPARLAWLEQHARSFGFMWENPRENWHLTYVEGDNVPPALRPPPEEDDAVKFRILVIEDGGGAAILLNGQVGQWLDPQRYNEFHYFFPHIVDERAAKSWCKNVVLTGPVPPGMAVSDFWQVAS